MSITHIHEVESPRVTIPDETEDSADVIAQNNLDKEPAVHELCTIENFIILDNSSLFVDRIGVSAPFVDIEDPLRDILHIRPNISRLRR